MIAGLMSSGERGDREREAAGKEEDVWGSIKVLANLMMRHNVRDHFRFLASKEGSLSISRKQRGVTLEGSL